MDKYQYETRLDEQGSSVVEYEKSPGGILVSRKIFSIIDESGSGQEFSVRFTKITESPYGIETHGIRVPRELVRRALYWAARSRRT